MLGKKFKYLVTPILAGCAIFAGCKKYNADVVASAPYTGAVLVNFNNYANDDGVFGLQKAGLAVKDEYVTVNVEVKISNTTGVAPNDIKVSLMKVDAIVSDYNTQNGTSYASLNLAQPGIVADFSKQVVIKKGERKASFPVQLNTQKLGFTQQYALGIGIAAVDGAGLNTLQSKLVLDCSALNAYDGYYQTKGAAYHPTYSDYVWNSNGVYACGSGFALTTSGQYSVDLYPGQPLYTAGTLTYFSAVVPRFTVNPTTNKVTITSTISSTVFVDYPAYDSRYDPATKTFFVKYGWSTNRIATDTFTFCGAR